MYKNMAEYKIKNYFSVWKGNVKINVLQKWPVSWHTKYLPHLLTLCWPNALAWVTIWTCDIKDVECKMELFCLMHLSLKHFFSPTLCLLYYQKHTCQERQSVQVFICCSHMYSCVKLTIESTVSQYYFQKFYNCILIIFKHVSIMIIIVEIRRYLECSIRNRFLMEQYKTDSPVTTFINRSKVW